MHRLQDEATATRSCSVRFHDALSTVSKVSSHPSWLLDEGPVVVLPAIRLAGRHQ